MEWVLFRLFFVVLEIKSRSWHLLSKAQSHTSSPRVAFRMRRETMRQCKDEEQETKV